MLVMAVAVSSALAKPPGDAVTRSEADLVPINMGEKVTVIEQVKLGLSASLQDASGVTMNSLMLRPSRLTLILPASAPPMLATSKENALFIPIGIVPKFC